MLQHNDLVGFSREKEYLRYKHIALTADVVNV